MHPTHGYFFGRLTLTWLTLGALGMAAAGTGCPQTPNNDEDGGTSIVTDSGTLFPPTDAGTPVLPDSGTPIVDAGPGPGTLLIDSINPPTGILTGGYRVRISGGEFTPNTRVFFNDIEADQVLFLNVRAITCRVPAGVAAGPAVVRIENEIGVGQTDASFTYFSPVTLAEIAPATGSSSGGTEVSVTGVGLHDDMIMLVGGAQAANLVIAPDGSSATFNAPPGRAGRADVEAVDAFGRSVLELSYTYVADLAAERVDPSIIPANSNVIIDVYGAGFDESTRVLIGGQLAALDNLISDGRMRVQLPAGLQGAQDVDIQRGAETVHLDGALVVVENINAPLLYATQPAVIDTAGMNAIAVGSGLNDVESVTVNNTAVPFTVLDENRLQFTAPASVAGTASLIATTATHSASLQIRYATPFVLNRVEPSQGSATGGERVTLTGRGFDVAAPAVVTFAGLPATDVVVVDENTIEATTPASGSGPVRVEVKQANRRVGRDSAFRYDAALRMLGVRPSRGGVSGGTFVTVNGAGFTSDGPVTVLFGQNPATDVVVVSDNVLVARTPFNLPGLVDVTVVGRTTTAGATSAFTYFDPTSLVGGTRGGEIDGAVYVTALDAFTGLPVEGLVAFLGDGENTSKLSLTNVLGQATLSGTDVVGPQTVSIVGDGYEYATLVDVNAAEITLYLQPLTAPPSSGNGQPPPTPPPAQIRGRVTGFAKELFDPAALGPDEIALAVVSTTARDEFSGTPDPGADNIVFEEGGQFFISNSRVGRLGLVALAGIFNLTTGEFNMKQMGVRREVYPDFGVELLDQDIDLNITLDKEIDFSLPDAPVGLEDGPTVTRVIPFLRLGGEGSFVYTDSVAASRNHQATNMPNVPGEMLTFISGAYRTDGNGLVTRAGTASLNAGNKIITGVGTNWAQTDFTGQPLVVGAIFYAESIEGERFASRVVRSNNAFEILLQEAPPFSGEGLTYHIGNPGTPSSEVIQNGVGDMRSGVTIQPVLGLPEPIDPVNNGVMTHRQLRWKAAPGQQPTVHVMNVYDAIDFDILWTFYIDGSRTKVPVPRIPAAVASLPLETLPKDFSAGGYMWQHSAIFVPEFEYNNFSFIDLSLRSRRSWTTDQHRFVYGDD